MNVVVALALLVALVLLVAMTGRQRHGQSPWTVAR